MGSNGGKSKDFYFFVPFKPLYCESTLTNRLKVSEQVFSSVLQHHTNYFQAEILGGNIFLEENKKNH